MPRNSQRRTSDRDAVDGFTLLEVLLATLVFATTMGLLLAAVSQSIAGLANARRAVDAGNFALQRAQSIAGLAAAGEPIQEGVREGPLPSPDDDLVWQESIVPARLPLPAEWSTADQPPSSPLWADPLVPESPPVLYRVDVRVYPANVEPSSIVPVTLFVVIPAVPPDAEGASE